MTHIHISCLCGNFSCRAQLSTEVPVKTSLCHKSQCRYNLGCISHSTLPLKDRPIDVDKLQAYTPADGQLVRFFCPDCGTHLFEQVGQAWNVQSGAVTEVHNEHILGALEDVSSHLGIEETKDGGIAVCFDTEGRDVANEKRVKSRPATSASVQDDIDPVFLEAHCVCGGVQFKISRPDSTSASCSSPWPDLIVPYHSKSSDNPGDVKWWICGPKWLAGLCACRSCRLGLGSPMQAWTFIAKSNMLMPDGSPLSYESGTMKTFPSAPGVEREFCGSCGATIFWHNEERPGVVDVSVGILRALDGALAKDWLSWWTKRVSFAEHALDQHLIGQLQGNLHRLADKP